MILTFNYRPEQPASILRTAGFSLTTQRLTVCHSICRKIFSGISIASIADQDTDATGHRRCEKRGSILNPRALSQVRLSEVTTRSYSNVRQCSVTLPRFYGPADRQCLCPSGCSGMPSGWPSAGDRLSFRLCVGVVGVRISADQHGPIPRPEPPKPSDNPIRPALAEKWRRRSSIGGFRTDDRRHNRSLSAARQDEKVDSKCAAPRWAPMINFTHPLCRSNGLCLSR
jgi:hypothetical protein